MIPPFIYKMGKNSYNKPAVVQGSNAAKDDQKDNPSVSQETSEEKTGLDESDKAESSVDNSLEEKPSDETSEQDQSEEKADVQLEENSQSDKTEEDKPSEDVSSHDTLKVIDFTPVPVKGEYEVEVLEGSANIKAGKKYKKVSGKIVNELLKKGLVKLL